MSIQFTDKRLVPVIVLDHVDQAAPLAEALLKAGLNVMEITFRTDAAEGSIRTIAQRFPEILVGAGTLLSADQVRRARDAGASFGLAPGLDETVLAAAGAAGLPFVPGVATASEINRALTLGLRTLKFFPAEALGGVKTLQALWGAFSHTGALFIPTGGITTANAPAYLSQPSVAAIGGSWMVDRKLIQAGDWAAIESLTREALAAGSRI